MSLPAPVTSFLGREAELAEAGSLLAEARLLTVTGPGGAGKTRFALELARRAGESGAGFDELGACSLASLRDSALVLPTVARTLELREQPGQSALEAIASHLHGKRTLLVADNLEHLPESWAELSALVGACPGLTLLVTSRAPVHAPHEVVYELPPLSDDEGIALFCERARTEPSPTIAEIAGRLEGLPLAIELAAARTKLITPVQLLERLSQRLDLLRGPRDADPRQQTLRATIEWSYDLLTEEEQRLFRALSVFSGGCTLEAAEEVCGADPGALRSLVDKSLLREAGGRYVMLETIRQYAEGEFAATEDEEPLVEQHVSHYVELAERAQDELSGPEQGAWVERLAVELPNYRRVLDRLFERGESLLLAQLAGALWRIWHRRGFLEEGRQWLDRALKEADSLPDDVRLRVEGGRGYIAIDQEDLGTARAHLETCVAIARTIGEPRIVANSLNNLGLVANREGDHEAAEALHLQALALRREVGDPGRIAASLNNLGFVALERRDLDRAEAYFEECLELFREVGDTRGIAVALGNLAEVAYHRGDPRGNTLNHESLRLSVELGERPGILLCLDSLAKVAASEGRLVRAARLTGATTSLAGSTGMAQPRDDGALASAREALGGGAWDSELAAGAAMTLEEIVAYALEEGSVSSARVA